jgi:L-threonylcarbamoyladenylate synthase
VESNSNTFSGADLNQIVKKAHEVIEGGGVILFPTDTIWGLGCDATNKMAVQRIYDMKLRHELKSMICLMESDAMLSRWVVDVPEVGYDLIELSEHPLTLILDGAKSVAENLLAPDGSLGVRVVKHTFCQRLIQKMRKPLVATSANISGNPFPKSFAEITPEILQAVDYIVPLDQSLTLSRPSTIIRLKSNGEVAIIRS